MPVSYTHLDVYKRQISLYPLFCNRVESLRTVFYRTVSMSVAAGGIGCHYVFTSSTGFCTKSLQRDLTVKNIFLFGMYTGYISFNFWTEVSKSAYSNAPKRAIYSKPIVGARDSPWLQWIRILYPWSLYSSKNEKAVSKDVYKRQALIREKWAKLRQIC